MSATRRIDEKIRRAEALRDHGALDGFALFSDYCFNTGPSLAGTPDHPDIMIVR